MNKISSQHKNTKLYKKSIKEYNNLAPHKIMLEAFHN